MDILKQSELIETPWKNGGGVTRKIASGMLAERVVWTISRADVAQDGPFSDFAGFMRVLTVVSGGSMTLETPTEQLTANLWQPVRFDGGLKIQSHLTGGPLTDLNLMFDPLCCDGEVRTRQGTLEHVINRPEHGLLAFHVLAGEPVINATRLTGGDTAFMQQSAAALVLGDGDAVLEIRLTYSTDKTIKLCIANR
ncbi:HutD/Ves family protein [Pseudorhodobacter wandonensis]|uniref:HutD/Ves family protein n=1 Tax=Pseudorhodobacter wandonensis TaxID=1120568 RepID=UPI00067ACCBB|nr:HutD family protein [Pseudorhodobacter wandonensis]